VTGTGLVLHRFDAAAAAAAERAGVGALWVHDDLTLLAALAVSTTTAALGALVDVTHRTPAIVAKQVTTIDLLSHGRARFAVGGDDAGQVEEALSILRGMFRDDRPAFAGRYWSIDGACNRPGPRQPGGPSILVAGHPALAVGHADGAVLTRGADDVRGDLAELAYRCDESGRDRASLCTLWWPPAPAGPDVLREATTLPGLDGIVLDGGPVDRAGTVAAVREALRGDR
jgi:alkanesulfonate monooxygenase SsuD/methylene tetrahydromethanopterin reductase-like flavin-dependent oxidoreductase (luciferase family)